MRMLLLTLLLAGCASHTSTSPRLDDSGASSSAQSEALADSRTNPPAQAPSPSSPTSAQAPTESAIAAGTSAPASNDAPVWREVFPHVRVNVSEGIVEFDGTVPIDVNSVKTPVTYLEVLVCTPDTKEHESLVVTQAKPSHVHAALLLIGLEPGAPGDWDWQGAAVRAIPPRGPRVDVRVSVERDGRREESRLTDWAWHSTENASLTDWRVDDGPVFAGSQMLRKGAQNIYRADGEGCLIGLTAFGGETIAWSRMFHHDSGLESPVWVARKDRVPPFGTPVVVRITATR